MATRIQAFAFFSVSATYHDGAEFTLTGQNNPSGWSDFGLPDPPSPLIVPFDTLDSRPVTGTTTTDLNGCVAQYTWGPAWNYTCSGSPWNGISATVSWLYLGDNKFRYTIDTSCTIDVFWCWRTQTVDGGGCVTSYIARGYKRVRYTQSHQVDITGDQSNPIVINFSAPAALSAGSPCVVDCFPMSPDVPYTDPCLLRYGFAFNNLTLTPTMVP